MEFHEAVINLHMHTYYSDGHATHDEIASAAITAGLDAVIVTDHNVWVDGPEDYYREKNGRALLLVGEEIHDQARDPQKNHLLVFGAYRELATFAHTPQLLIDNANKASAVSFIAHPDDPDCPIIGETDITWVDWEVRGFTGIELWNGLSEFKTVIKSKLHAIFYAYFPQMIAHGPQPATLARWNKLLAEGRRVVAIGGSDAHNLPARLGPLRRRIFPYAWHFRGVNTHLLLPRPLSGEDAQADGRLILEALRQGHAWVGYDLPYSTRGFRFTALGKEKTAIMGDEIAADGGITFQIRLPVQHACRLLKDGQVLRAFNGRENYTHTVTEPGVYRVEAEIHYYGRPRGWIFSNPIYVR